jgi:hypothetical protein
LIRRPPPDPRPGSVEGRRGIAPSNATIDARMAIMERRHDF